MKIKKKKRKLYNSDFSSLKTYQIFDDSEHRYVHYGSRLRRKHPEHYSLKWERVTCPNCRAYHKRQRLAAKRAELLSKTKPQKGT